MKKYRSIYEAKQVGTLYHFTLITSMLKIINDNSLGEDLGKFSKTSLTRDKNLWKRTKIIPHESYFIINGDKLSNKYKIKPYQFNAHHFSQSDNNLKTPISGKIEDQMEEVVFGIIKPLNKYTKKVIIFDVDLDEILFDDDSLEEISEILKISPENIERKDILNFITKKGFKYEIK